MNSEKLSKDKIRELGREELLKILELKVGRRLVEGWQRAKSQR